jgi:hypothetical protein
MKNKIILSFVLIALLYGACQKEDFENSYADPSKISQTTIEKQFTGFLGTNRWYVLPDYWNYFVVLRTSINTYTQAIGWANADNQYVPPSSGLNSRWDTYYNFMAQYREFENVFAGKPADEQAARRIYMIAATIYLYDHTQRVVDLHGDIPFSAAGKLSANGGDYTKSYAQYDDAAAIYTKMLDDLKGFSDELNSMTIGAGIQAGFKTQDFINKGDVAAWKRYCNSLRLRMLTRVSGASAFSARATSEIASIVGDAAKYPVVTKNTENIQINVFDINSEIHAKGFRSGLEDWNGNIAGKAMIDHMKKGSDPRLRALFEPGAADTAKQYIGLDPMLDGAAQAALIAGGKMAIYNRSTLSRNQFFPGVLMNAAEVSLHLAEYYLKSGNDAAAKTAYENAIKQSTEFYYNVRKISNDNTAIALVPYTDAEVTAYTNSADVKWDAAGANKLALIATQKWIHFNVIQPIDNWSETRRLNLPSFAFREDNTNAQKVPPVRWFYPTSESIYNAENYDRVRSNDVLNKKIFWDN